VGVARTIVACRQRFVERAASLLARSRPAGSSERRHISKLPACRAAVFFAPAVQDGRANVRPHAGATRPNPMPYLYLTIAILAEVIGTSALKASEGFTRPKPSLVVVIGYGVAFYFLSLALQSLAVGVAYAIWSGAGVALITVIGWRVFKQRLDAPALLGIGLIVSGVVVLQWSAKAVA